APEGRRVLVSRTRDDSRAAIALAEYADAVTEARARRRAGLLHGDDRPARAPGVPSPARIPRSAANTAPADRARAPSAGVARRRDLRPEDPAASDPKV